MNDTSPKKMIWEKAATLVRNIFFDSGWDFLKAGVLAVLFFVWGNFLGWFYEPPRSLKVELNYMGNFFEGYGFISIAFDDFEADTENKIPLLFDPPNLRRLRVCQELNWKDTGRGMKYLRRVADEYSQCIQLNVENLQGTTRATITKAKNPTLLKTVSRDGSDNWFCGCEQKVLNAFAADTKNNCE